eukprot:9475816-Pyramimonas_sp.AAC.2
MVNSSQIDDPYVVPPQHSVTYTSPTDSTVQKEIRRLDKEKRDLELSSPPKKEPRNQIASVPEARTAAARANAQPAAPAGGA